MPEILRLLDDGRLEWRAPGSGELQRGSPDPGQVPRPVVLVPGEDVLVTSVEIAARQRQRLLQAVPYAVEDQLVEEVDRHHFALGPAFGAGRHLVAAVLRERMRDWLETLAGYGVSPRALLPDTLAVVPDPEAVVVVLDGERALLRQGIAEAVALGCPELPDFLALLGDAPIRVLGEGALPPGLELPREAASEPALALLAAGLDDAPAVDLLQGEFAVADGGRRSLRRVLAAAALLAGLALTLESSARIVRLLDDRADARALEAASASLLRETFPDIQRVVNPRLQMQQRLAGLGADGSAGGVLNLLRVAGPALAADSSVVLQALSFRDAVLTVELEAPDFPPIEALRQRLVAARLEARLESSTTLGDRATARLRISGAP